MPSHLPQYQEAEYLETYLGDPFRASNSISHRQAVTLDEAEAFPEAAMSHLHGYALHHFYVPAKLGGGFSTCEEVISMARVLARRDMNVAVSYSTMVWTMLAWIGGDPAQKQRVADLVLRAGTFPCLAYSEAPHGADLAANELVATKTPQGYVLNGEKWPINRATRSDLVVLLARTGEKGGARSQSLFIIDKRELNSASYYHLPRVKTYGLRGCDISGIGFRGCRVPANARIGQEGAGLELALKGFQVTRTFCAGLSLGAGDTLLRSVVDFLKGRQLYGASAVEIPHAREVIANSYLSLLIGECVATAAARGLHLFPDHFSAWSAIAKVHTTKLVDHAGQSLAGVLGARFYMREQHQEGMFQKMLRDSAIVSVFDGSSIVCLDSLATQLPSLARGHERALETDWSQLYDLRTSLPELNLQKLDLFGRGRDAVPSSLPHLLRMLDGIEPTTECPTDRLTRLRAAALAVSQRLILLDAAAIADPPQRGKRLPPQQFALAESYCGLHAAIACLGVWLHNRDHLGGFFAEGVWLLAALERSGGAHFETGSLDAETREALTSRLLDQYHDHQLFSLLSLRLAEPGQIEGSSPSENWKARSADISPFTGADA